MLEKLFAKSRAPECLSAKEECVREPGNVLVGAFCIAVATIKDDTPGVAQGARKRGFAIDASKESDHNSWCGKLHFVENTSPPSPRTLAFLRAINVGSHVVKMERLRQLFCELGLQRVGSYIQTGNLFFEMPGDQTPEALTQRIEARLLDAQGYEVPTFLRTVAQVERALQLAAFEGLDVGPDTRQLVLFTSAALPLSLEVPLRLPVRSPAADLEIVGVTPGEVFVQLRLVHGRPGNPGEWIEKTWGVKTTARFVGTTFKILQTAKDG